MHVVSTHVFSATSIRDLFLFAVIIAADWRESARRARRRAARNDKQHRERKSGKILAKSNDYSNDAIRLAFCQLYLLTVNSYQLLIVFDIIESAVLQRGAAADGAQSANVLMNGEQTANSKPY